MVRRKRHQKAGVETDVLVVGAGPAGGAAAWTLAREGAKVTLIDRDEAPGAKACAGGLTRDAWSLAGIDSATPPPYAETFSALSVFTSLGSLTLAPRDTQPAMMTVDRRQWQRRLLERAAIAGAEIRLGQRLVRVSEGEAETSDDRIRFSVLVGADGAASRVRRYVGLPRSAGLKAVQARLKKRELTAAGIDVRAPGVWFDPEHFGAGYGWGFPFQDEVRLGLALSPAALGKRRIGHVFCSWLSRLGIPSLPISLKAGTIPAEYSGHRFGRVYLAGDAAGLASPLTGEGIAQALVSGHEVAREILMPTYHSSIIPTLSARHRRTRDLLSKWPMPHLLTGAPWILRIPALRQMALERYVTVSYGECW